MKKAAALVLAAVLLASAALTVFAAGEDTLVPLSYLTGTFLPDLLSQAGRNITAAGEKTYNSVLAETVGGEASGLGDVRFKRGDTILLPTGSGVMLLAGSAAVTYSGGAVVDTAAGQILASGGYLSANHRCLAAENTKAAVSIASETAVLSLEGAYTFSPSAETDYNALAGALKDMGLFQGTGTAYGSGYDLEKIPTRVEGLVMFLRMLGEENAALSYAGGCPFSDVPDWAVKYVGYAYSKGYTKGVGGGRFGPFAAMGAVEYTTFLLRVLGYSDSGSAPDFTWQTALEKGRDTGLLTGGEYTLLKSAALLRAHVAYLSYYALDAGTRTGSTLLDTLCASGALSRAAVNTVRAGVTVERIR